ncbi:MAG: histidinol dehydrogenase [SAR324 cluster bacterium]|nr:histidinol dehydrogenase [SAR324 cluster bacterium]
MNVNIFNSFNAYRAHLESHASHNISNTVQEIIAAVRERGDAALKEYTEKFDGAHIDNFRIPESQMQQALHLLDPKLKQILLEAADNIRKFHQRQKSETQLEFSEDGTVLGWKVTPIDAVGVYVPGGRAVLFSTLLMNVIPAQVAEVPRIAVLSPPEKNGLPSPLMMAAAALMGVQEMYAIGGAQAIAALAYGTESVPRVFKITGPGNAYVAEAKRQVYGVVGIESIAGPSDILILCDQRDASIEYLTRDMLSQAEHDPEARALLITTSTEQATSVAERLQNLVPTLPKREIIEASFDGSSAIITVDDLDSGFEAVNEIAPEHLEILTAQPFNDLHKVRNAGAIFLGPNTPEPVGDYYAGPNHTIPTSGCAKFSSPLGVQDFVKSSSILKYSASRLRKEGPSIIGFAEAEGLHAHAAAIQARLDQFSLE